MNELQTVVQELGLSAYFRYLMLFGDVTFHQSIDISLAIYLWVMKFGCREKLSLVVIPIGR